jgi:spore coat protein U-like protein
VTRARRFLHRRLLRALCALVLLCAAQAGQAQTCTVSSTALAFGVYAPTLGTPNDSVATITVTCQATVSLLVGYTITLGGGNSGNPAARSMPLSGGGGGMNYQVYSDLLRTQVWGDGGNGTAGVADGYLISVIAPYIKTYSAFGRIPALQNAKAGSYADSLLVTITY